MSTGKSCRVLVHGGGSVVQAILDVGRQLSIYDDGALLTVYRFGPDTPKPFFHPLLLGDGRDASLTLTSPYDHLHHRGLWFAWTFVNGHNFWEEDPVCNWVMTRNLQVDGASAERIRWTSELDWQTADSETLLTERRTLTVGQPRVSDESRHYTIDFDLQFRPALPEIYLSLRSVKEVDWGGYAGLGYRPARSMDIEGQVLTSNGPATIADKGVPARWADYSGGLDGAKQMGGVALFDHPDNARHPVPFFVIDPQPFGFLNPSLLFDDGLRMHHGETLRLRYRVLVHSEPGAAEGLERHYQDWVNAWQTAAEKE